MNITYFDRHACMDLETLQEVKDLINEVEEFGYRSLVNKLYGLFDGFLYSDILVEAEGLPSEIVNRIDKLLTPIKSYPIL